MNGNRFKIVGLGEILWDLLPSGKQLGGAPANFAYVATQLGDRGSVASRVGEDSEGREAIDLIRSRGVGTDLIQSDPEHPTGSVIVTFNGDQPKYEIVPDVAWDRLEFSNEWQAAAGEADAVCFGSLAQRSTASGNTIRSFLSHTRPDALRVFDVNLRCDFFDPEVLRASLGAANVAKLNNDELPVVCAMFGIVGSDENAMASMLRAKFDLNLLCVTRGSRGSLLVTSRRMDEHRGISTEVADTIGAGDAFTAAMTHGLLRNWPLGTISEFANRVGSFVASRSGAMPPFEKFMKQSGSR